MSPFVIREGAQGPKGQRPDDAPAATSVPSKSARSPRFLIRRYLEVARAACRSGSHPALRSSRGATKRRVTQKPVAASTKVDTTMKYQCMVAGFSGSPAALVNGTPWASANTLAFRPMITSTGPGIRLALNPADTPANAAAMPINGLRPSPA